MKNNYGKKMDIVTSVIFVENALLAGRTGFCVNTDFGKIVVELNTMFEDNVIVTPWTDAPPTKFAMLNRNMHNDFYIAILPGKTKYITHTRVIMAITKCLFFNIFPDEEPSESIIDASIKAYLMGVDGHIPTINAVCRDWAVDFMTPVIRNEASVKNLIRDMIIRRDDLANSVLISAEEIINKNTKYLCEDKYYQTMIGIFMYMGDLIGKRDFTYVSLHIHEGIENIIDANY